MSGNARRNDVELAQKDLRDNLEDLDLLLNALDEFRAL